MNTRSYGGSNVNAVLLHPPASPPATLKVTVPSTLPGHAAELCGAANPLAA